MKTHPPCVNFFVVKNTKKVKFPAHFQAATTFRLVNNAKSGCLYLLTTSFY